MLKDHHPASEVIFERDLGGTLLASVARSFYLSLKFLPGEIRGAGGLGYLLARATDTVADTEAVPVGERLELLGAMGAAVQGEGETPDFVSVREDRSVSAGEAKLLGKFGDCLAWLEAVPDWQREAIRKVLRPIVRGQSNDLRRFSGEGSAALESEVEAKNRPKATLKRRAFMGSKMGNWTSKMIAFNRQIQRPKIAPQKPKANR